MLVCRMLCYDISVLWLWQRHCVLSRVLTLLIKPNSTNHARVFGCKKTSKCPNLCQALHWNFSAGY